MKSTNSIQPAPVPSPFLAISSSATPAAQTSTPATVDARPVARTRASHQRSGLCSSGDSSRNMSVITTAKTSARIAMLRQKYGAAGS